MKKAILATILGIAVIVIAVSMGINVDAQGETRSISMTQDGNILIFEKSSDEPANFPVFWGVSGIGEVEDTLSEKWDGNSATLIIPVGSVSVHFYPFGWELTTNLAPAGSDWYWLLPVTKVTVTPTSSPTSTSTPTVTPTVDPTATLVPTLEPTALPTGTPEPTATSTPVPSVSMEGDQGKIVFIANTEILEPLVIRWGIPGTPAEYLVWDGNVARITPPEGATTLWFSPGELDLTTEFEPIEQNWFYIPVTPERLTFLPFLVR